MLFAVSLHPMPHIHQINVSDGGVPKLPVDSVYVGNDHIVGDRQADTKHHGGPRQTLCLYSRDVIELLQLEGHPIGPGSAGENLTIAGLSWGDLAEGDRFQIGEELQIELTDPATPCAKNAQWFLEGDFRRMSHEKNPGSSRWYARVLQPGEVTTGDPVEPIEE